MAKISSVFRSKVYFTVVLAVVLLFFSFPKSIQAVEEEEEDNIEEVSSDLSKGKGFGDSLAWKSLDDGLAAAKEENKPLMLIIHKSWCGACAALKPKFASANEISELSNHFVMVNSEDDDETEDKAYAPDGVYYPRILFLNSDGEVLENIFNKGGNPEYKYYYSEPSMIIQSMNEAMKFLEIGPKDEL